MAQPDRNSSRDNKRNNEPNFNWRGIVLIAIAFGLIGMALLVRNGGYQNIEDVPYNRFIELLDNKQIINDKNLPVTLLVQEIGRASCRARVEIWAAAVSVKKTYC